MRPRIIFMGTPEFAAPALRAVAADTQPADLLVVTQPDRPSGRGRKVQPPAVKAAALDLGLEVVQVESLRDADARTRLEAFAPGLVIVAAFGLLLPRWVLRLPRRGCVNLHASLLPRFRGASPVAAAIACGDERTGVCLMEMEAGLDTGAVLARAELTIDRDATTASLTERLALLASDLIAGQLGGLVEGALTPSPQRGHVVETRKIVKDHGAIDWSRPAVDIERHVRAMLPWPRAWTVGAGDTRLQIHAASVASAASSADPGTVGRAGGDIVVATGDGGLRLDVIQLPGKQPQPAGDRSQHAVLADGSRLGYPDGFQSPVPWIVDAGEVE